MSKASPIFGIDVHPQYQSGLDFTRVKQLGYAFCWVKASQGSSYVPTGFRDYFARAQKTGMIMGLYHFLDESASARAQVDNFLRAAGLVGGVGGKMLAVDFEDYGDLSPSNATLRAFVAELRRRIGDHPIVLYSAAGFWNGGDPSGAFAQYGADALWEARYANMDRQRYPREHYEEIRDWKAAWGGFGGVAPLFWQFTSTGLVADQFIDVNAFRGTREMLESLAREGVGAVKPPPDPKEPMSQAEKAIVYMKKLLDPPTVYGFWDGKFPFTPGPAMWANVRTGHPPDPKTQVPNASCTGLINLGNAAGGSDYRGGTLAYAKDLANKRRFHLGMRVKKGEVLLDRYMETSREDEGHIVMAIEDGTDPLVISSDHRFGGNQPGVNVHRLSVSYRLFDYGWIGEVPGLGTG